MKTFSAGKLIWIHERQNERDSASAQRALMIATAAQAGGDAPDKVFKMLERQKRKSGNRESQKPQSQTPTSQAEFEAMLAEENAES